eukprot:4481585-Alexandrium_andersonii.AAC.1
MCIRDSHSAAHPLVCAGGGAYAPPRRRPGRCSAPLSSRRMLCRLRSASWRRRSRPHRRPPGT